MTVASQRLIQIGSATIGRVEELVISNPIATIVDDADLVEAHRHWLAPHYLDADDRFDLTFQSFLLFVDDRVIVIDPCTGNGRPHPVPYFDRLAVPFIERMVAAGVRPHEVDFVVCTHLHHDHCGWNTQLRDGQWVPTFPNARYIFARAEYERWVPTRPGHRPYAYNDGVFERSIQPVIEAGLVDLAGDRHALSPALTLLAAPGHTDGHSMLHLTSAGREALFSGDAFHHPLQLVRPELQFGDVDDLDQAIATRRHLNERCAGRDILVVPAHMPFPHGLRVGASADGGYRYAAAGANEVPT